MLAPHSRPSPLSPLLALILVAGCSGDESSSDAPTCPDDAIAVATEEAGGEIRWCQRPEGTAHGWYEARDAAGTLIAEGAFVDDAADGDWRYWDAEGRIEREETWKAGIRCGVWKRYAAGNLTGDFDHGACDALPEPSDGEPPSAEELGVWPGLECGDGAVLEDDVTVDGRPYRACLKAGVREGDYTAWNEDSSVYESGAYSGGQRDGAWKRFWNTGVLREEGTMKAGARHGEWTRYDPLARKVSLITYRDGALHGPWTDWFPDGSVDAETAFTAGRPSGTWRLFYPDGSLASEGGYQDGARFGEWLFWRADGVQSVRANFDTLGRPDGDWTLNFEADDEVGAQYQVVPYRSGVIHGVAKAFWSDGDVPISEVAWNNDAKQGAFVEWFMDGSVRFRGQYANDREHGVFEGFHPNGADHSHREYTYGTRVGTWTFWWGNGQVRGTGSWEIYDIRASDWVYFLEDGSPASAEAVGL